MAYFIMPVEAYRRRLELTTGEWDLYVTYLSHRNQDDGRCDPSRALLMAEMEVNYDHLCRLKAALVSKEWIGREGRNQVTLLVGEFPPLKVEKLTKSADLNCGNTQNSPATGHKTDKKRRLNCGNTQSSRARDPYTDEQLSEQKAAAAAPDPMLAEVTEEFITNLIAQGFYPAESVYHVWRKLRAHCFVKQTVPVVRQLMHWLNTEDYTKPVQPLMPGFGATVHEFQPPPAAPEPLPLDELASYVCACVDVHGRNAEDVIAEFEDLDDGQKEQVRQLVRTALAQAGTTVTDEVTDDERRTAHN